jgi:hypothetical protein
MKAFIFWNGSLRVILESYLEVTLVCMIILKKYEFTIENDSIQEYIDNYSFLIFCIIYVPIPFLLTVFIIVNRTQIKKEIYWMDIVKTSTIKVSP